MKKNIVVQFEVTTGGYRDPADHHSGTGLFRVVISPIKHGDLKGYGFAITEEKRQDCLGDASWQTTRAGVSFPGLEFGFLMTKLATGDFIRVHEDDERVVLDVGVLDLPGPRDQVAR